MSRESRLVSLRTRLRPSLIGVPTGVSGIGRSRRGGGHHSERRDSPAAGRFGPDSARSSSSATMFAATWHWDVGKLVGATLSRDRLR